VEICENGDAILELPPELCEDLGWKEGTVLNIELENGQIIISEVNNDDKNK
jgi:antitoxin component of MazEF toxin-antitoxin module